MPAPADSSPALLDSTPRLFVDDHLVAARSGVVRRVEPCRKLIGPVLEAESPWEGSRVYVYGTVLRDPADGVFRIRSATACRSTGRCGCASP